MQLDKILSLDRAVTFERPDPLHVIRLPVALYGTHKRVITPNSIFYSRHLSRIVTPSPDPIPK